MAEENEEYDQLLEEINVNVLMVLQAYIRGTITRKWLKDLRFEYQQIGQEIERKDFNIEWSSEQPCLPKLLNKRKLHKNVEKSKDKTCSVEIQTDFKTFEVKDNQLNSFCALGTESDPVVINDSVLDISNVTDPKQNRLDSLDSIPVRDSDSSHSPVISNEQLNKEVTSDIALDLQNSSMPNFEGTTVKEMTKVVENSVMCDVTSVWDAELSSFATEEIRLPTEKNELKELRKNLAMELLWIQQAIQSRKNYLQLKTQMGS